VIEVEDVNSDYRGRYVVDLDYGLFATREAARAEAVRLVRQRDLERAAYARALDAYRTKVREIERLIRENPALPPGGVRASVRCPIPSDFVRTPPVRVCEEPYEVRL
jgi:hypothetical protein